jgi:hypothetical protein
MADSAIAMPDSPTRGGAGERAIAEGFDGSKTATRRAATARLANLGSWERRGRHKRPINVIDRFIG